MIFSSSYFSPPVSIFLTTLTALLVFIIGTVIGSFLNVLIDRIPAGEGVMKGRSYCDSCRHQLAWYDLIPLFSWVWLRAKCRYCKTSISWQYPAVELVTGLLFILPLIYDSGFRIQDSGISGLPVTGYLSPVTIFHWFILSALVVIFVVDLKYYIIPDKVLVPTFLLVLMLRIMQVKFSNPEITCYLLPVTCYSFINPLLSSIGSAAFFLFLVLITRGKGMGFGDVKFALFMGLLLGFPGVVVALYIAFLTGAVVSVILILLKKKKFGQHIPFGPFLVAGTVVGMYWGENLWNIFWSLY